MSSDWPPAIRGVLFDFDGTLTEPGSIDFPAIKKALGCPPTTPILEFIDGLSTREEREEAFRLLDRYEMEAAEVSKPNRAAEDLIRYLRSRSILLGIISRNNLCSILRAFENFAATSAADFKVIVSREDARPKPHPEGIFLAAREMGLEPREMLTVGDYVFDIEAAQRADSPTVLLTNGSAPVELSEPPDHVISRLNELKGIIEPLLPLCEGKLPNHLLQQFLEQNPLDDPSVLVPPGVGEDTAAVELAEGEEVIVLKSDPITFTMDRLGYSTVVINANDLVTSGAVPRWLLTTLLFPAGSSAAQVHHLMEEVQRVCREFELTLCGGHTEITSSVNQPVAVGHLVGTTARDRLIDKRRMTRGDHILLTGGAAVEGTSILARDYPGELRALGMPEHEIEACQRLFQDPGISIVKEARIAADTRRVTAMHDVTEGGLATALEELSAAGGHRITITADRIPILPGTRKICDLLGIHPLGLLGSGSLLIACPPDASADLTKALQTAGVQVSSIGEVLDDGVGIEACAERTGTPVDWPHFEVDEIVPAIQRLQAVRDDADPGEGSTWEFTKS